MKKLSHQEFHRIFFGVVDAPELIGYGPHDGAAFRRGWETAIERVYSRLVDPARNELLKDYPI